MNDELGVRPRVFEGDVQDAATIGAPPDAQAITVGPDEVLVVRTPRIMSPAEVAEHRRTMTDALGAHRFIILMGDWHMGKVSAAAEAGLRELES